MLNNGHIFLYLQISVNIFYHDLIFIPIQWTEPIQPLSNNRPHFKGKRKIIIK